MTNSMPVGWTTATLSELGVEIRGSVRPTDGISYELYSVPAFPTGSPEIIDGADVGSAKRPVAPGDILLCKINPRINRVWLVSEDHGREQLASTEYLVFRVPEAERDPLARFMMWYFRSPRFREWIKLRAEGATGSHTRAKSPVILRHEVPIAPAAEQRRIVAAIEEQFSRIDAGVDALQRTRRNLQRMRTAVLQAAADGTLTAEWRTRHPDVEPASALVNRIAKDGQRRRPPVRSPEVPRSLPSGWCWVTLEQLTPADRPSAYGVLQPGHHIPNGVPLVRVNDISDGMVATEQLKRIAPAISERYKRTVLQGGEVLLTIVGTIGRTAVVPSEIAGANIARAVAVIPVAPPIEPRYVEIMLRDPRMRARLTLRAHEVARKTLNLEDVRVTMIPLCSLREAAEVVSEVERRLSFVNEIESQIEVALRRADLLRQSILRCAFEGKLVPQESSDEPAGMLLARIRNGQTAASAMPTVARGVHQ